MVISTITTAAAALTAAVSAVLNEILKVQHFDVLARHQCFFGVAFAALQDVTEVVNTCHEAGISKLAVKLRPIAVIKG